MCIRIGLNVISQIKYTTWGETICSALCHHGYVCVCACCRIVQESCRLWVVFLMSCAILKTILEHSLDRCCSWLETLNTQLYEHLFNWMWKRTIGNMVLMRVASMFELQLVNSMTRYAWKVLHYSACARVAGWLWQVRHRRIALPPRHPDAQSSQYRTERVRVCSFARRSSLLYIRTLKPVNARSYKARVEQLWYLQARLQHRISAAYIWLLGGSGSRLICSGWVVGRRPSPPSLLSFLIHSLVCCHLLFFSVRFETSKKKRRFSFKSLDELFFGENSGGQPGAARGSQG